MKINQHRSVYPIVTLLFLGLALLPSAQANTALGSVGLSMGLLAPSDNLQSRFAWGVRTEYRALPLLRTGAWIVTASKMVGALDSRITSFGIDGALMPGEDSGGFYAGGKLGATILSNNLITSGTDTTAFTAGPQMGWDYFFYGKNEGFSIGPEFSYLFVFAPSNSIGIFSMLFSLKLHF